MGNSARAVIDRKQRFVAALSVFMELLDKNELLTNPLIS